MPLLLAAVHCRCCCRVLQSLHDELAGSNRGACSHAFEACVAPFLLRLMLGSLCWFRLPCWKAAVALDARHEFVCFAQNGRQVRPVVALIPPVCYAMLLGRSVRPAHLVRTARSVCTARSARSLDALGSLGRWTCSVRLASSVHSAAQRALCARYARPLRPVRSAACPTRRIRRTRHADSWLSVRLLAALGALGRWARTACSACLARLLAPLGLLGRLAHLVLSVRSLAALSECCYQVLKGEF